MIAKLHVQNLRLIEKQTLTELSRQTLLLGENAQGKTTLLEAVYLLATFSSFRTAKDNTMLSLAVLKDPLAVGRVRAQFIQGGQTRTIEVRLIQEEKNGEKKLRKEILVDGVKRKAAEAIGTLRAVIFAPQMTDMIGGSQNERRRHLNMAISQAIPGYAAALVRYNEALSQRNALLKMGGRRTPPEQLAPWNEVLASSGALLIASRARAAQELSRFTMPFQKKITEGKEIMRVVYLPSYDPAPPASDSMEAVQTACARRAKVNEGDIAAGLRQALEQSYRRDTENRSTSIGPHRDSIEFWVNGRDLSNNGSRGQMRTAALALKTAEARWIEKETGEAPILLLDDPMTELDASRRAGLTELLKMPNQIIATATETLQFPEKFLEETSLWQVSNGVLRPAALEPSMQ